MNRLAEHLREENAGPTGSHRLEALLIELGHFDQARKIFKTL